MIRRPPRSTHCISSAASDVYKRQEYNVLLSGTSDVRHILRTLSNLKEPPKIKLNIYINETEKETLARILLQLLIVNECTMTKTERTELFLDIFGNALIRQKSQDYLDSQAKPLTQLVTNDKRCMLPLKSLVDLSLLKFKELDELETIIASWKSSVPFDIEKFRDNRLRHYYQEDYDFRGNFVDWDYMQYICKTAPIISEAHYRRFRQHGIAFEEGFGVYCVGNRTLASYAEGRKWVSKDSCAVRGYWGDVLASPYFAFGTEVDSETEKKKFFSMPLVAAQHPYVILGVEL
eukprot:TRINITY_DN5312_c0_g2_i3.p1 TRINITY_DN5312_c0_g2~~TRINITY_DN5312_c0_g2_i3.p1  ORF type:complete len:299 (+),score=65.10 TRINITY_DN5312_c0_g2_i3:25-897(+)